MLGNTSVFFGAARCWLLDNTHTLCLAIHLFYCVADFWVILTLYDWQYICFLPGCPALIFGWYSRFMLGNRSSFFGADFWTILMLYVGQYLWFLRRCPTLTFGKYSRFMLGNTSGFCSAARHWFFDNSHALCWAIHLVFAALTFGQYSHFMLGNTSGFCGAARRWFLGKFSFSKCHFFMHWGSWIEMDFVPNSRPQM